MSHYGWKRGFADFQKRDAQGIGDELERLRGVGGGSLKPSAIVKAARTASSPLHPIFPWDDAKAAHIAREMIAGRLLRAITVRIERVEGKPIDTRAFVSTKTTDRERRYTSVSTALEDEEGRAYLVREAWLHLKSWRRRYAELAELADVFDAIDAAALKRTG